MTDRIAITGANGFVGRALSRLLLQQGREVTGIIRAAGDLRTRRSHEYKSRHSTPSRPKRSRTQPQWSTSQPAST